MKIKTYIHYYFQRDDWPDDDAACGDPGEDLPVAVTPGPEYGGIGVQEVEGGGGDTCIVVPGYCHCVGEEPGHSDWYIEEQENGGC